MIDGDLIGLVRTGAAIVVATLDGERHPELARAWGPRVSDDGSELVLCVEGGAGSRTVTNLHTSGVLCARLMRLAAGDTATVVGPVVAVGRPTPEDLAAVSAHVDAFVAETGAVGAPEQLSRALVAADLLRVTVSLTAGPAADPVAGAVAGHDRPVVDLQEQEQAEPEQEVAFSAVQGHLGAGLSVAMAVCGASGLPQIEFITSATALPGSRIATSRQAFNVGLATLTEGARAQVLVTDPATAQEYRVDLRHEGTAMDGPEHRAVQSLVHALTAATPMGPAFRLRGVDLHAVVRCARVPRQGVDQAARRLPDPLSLLVRYTRRLEDVIELPALRQEAVDLHVDLLGLSLAVLLVPDPGTGRLVVAAAAPAPQPLVGATTDGVTGLVGTAMHRRHLLAVGNLAHMRALAGNPEPTSGRAAQAPQATQLPVPVLTSARSVGAVPLIVAGEALGVLYLEHEEPYSLGPLTPVLRILGSHTAAALAALGARDLYGTSTDVRPATPQTSSAEPADAVDTTPFRVIYYRNDDTVLCNGRYVARGTPGRILWSLLHAHARTGRLEFTNRELRLDPHLQLPAGNDNLESRLLTLRRRLDELDDGISIERTGRGQFRLSIDRPVRLTVAPAAARPPRG